MAQTINLAKKHNIGVGAHPDYPDLLGFGRREMQLTPEEAKDENLFEAMVEAVKTLDKSLIIFALQT
jgi:lactam utilization protein B